MASSFHMNIFRILGDVSHTASKCILIWAIHSNKSAEGVSLLTQLLYCLVFTTRYLDLFWVPPWFSWWNFVLKLFYIASSAYIVFVMMRVFARTREKEYGWKLAIWSLAGSTVGAPIVCLLFEGWKRSTLSEVIWTFSIILESVCVLPQLLLLRQTSVPTVLDSFYLVTLGSYRFFYILNWIVKMFSADHTFDATSVVFGLIQTALYVDFAWVYWSRQRVKLRYGGIVDSEDLSKSFIVKRFIGRRNNQNGTDDDDITEEEDRLAAQESGTVRPGNNRTPSDRWGARGISVSADDTLQEHLDHSSRDAQMVDPSHFEDDDEDEDAPPPPAKDAPQQKSKAAESASSAGSSGVATPDTEDAVGSSAAEWSNK
ncbi:hypothetical protein CKM354_000530700 [Cercospora kikuchii]|uniref:ER lumen protein retaining receptor n=1 Tax=Cercospora kikuchii TaxID=84275 RepID=A0A9P3CF19_9PEZI|nr:uncharacterized protein CKM354_000530700 [Cercospora kikuchii]GIZ42027.1 hypothetical protein CKM354_000530700 [Cercospora kikuchii]